MECAVRACLTLVMAVLWPLLAIGWPDRAWAAMRATDGVLCHMATGAAELATGVPDQLLTAISRVESGRADAAGARTEAWPWTINVEGAGHFYDTKSDAIDAVAAFVARGARSIDVGCMQINLKQHPEAFASLAEAFDPAANALFAARFLKALFAQTGSWPHAAAAYHSLTPEIGHDYQNQVLQMWALGDGPAPRGARSASGGGSDQAASGSVFAAAGASGGGAAPFGAPSTFSKTLYEPRPAATASGRSLADYRGRPVALAARFAIARRF